MKKVSKQALTYQVPGLAPGRGDLRRVRILEATIELISDENMEAVTLSSVAAHCGIRRSHVAYYYQEPSSLIRSAIEYVLSVGQSMAVDHILSATTVEDRLRAFVTSNFRWFQKNPSHSAVFGLFHYLSLINPDYRLLNKKVSEMAEHRLRAIMLGANPQASPGKVDEVAAAMRALLVGSLARIFCEKKSPSSQALAKEERWVSDQFVYLAEQVWK